MAEKHVHNQEFLNSLVELILANIGNYKFGARELAVAAGMRQRKLSHKLRTIKSVSVSRFICETRLHKALELLQTEDLTASEVAYKVGFGSPTYFNKCFHEFFGYPPGKFRKEGSDITGDPEPLRKGSGYLTGISFIQKVIGAIGGLLALSALLLFVNSMFIKKPELNDSVKNSKIREKSLAVLPFKNLSDSAANQYFIDGVMEEVLTDLSSIGDLRVISRTSVEQYRESNNTASEIAKKLKVEYLVRGSGQKYANSCRLWVQLIDASSDKQIWAQSYEQEIKDAEDIFRMQSQIAQSIAVTLKATLTPEEGEIIKKSPTSNLTAFEFYQRGRYELLKCLWPDYNPKIVKRAEVLFKEALEYDSTFAEAYAGLAEVFWIKYDRDYKITDNKILNNYLDSMLILSDIALKFDNKLSEAYCVRGGYYDYKGSTGSALMEWDNALLYNSNYYQAYILKGSRDEDIDLCKSLGDFNTAASLTHGPELPMILGRIGHNYYMAGLPEKGIYYLNEALKLDGDSIKYFTHLNIFETEVSGEIRKAVEYFQKRYLVDSSDASLLLRLGYFHSLIGDYSGSLKYYKRYLSILPGSSYSNQWAKDMMEYLIGYAFFENGYKKEADFYFTRSVERYKKKINTDWPGGERYYIYRLAGIYAYRGEKRRAYEYLNRFSQAPIFYSGEVQTIKYDPLFNSLRDDPEFQNIMQIVETKYKVESERVRKWLNEQGTL